MIFITLAAICAVIGVIPALFGKNPKVAIPLVIAYFLVLWFIFWKSCPSLAYPLFSEMSFLTVVLMVISAFASANTKGQNIAPVGVTGLCFIVILVTGFSGCEAFHAPEYSSLIGNVDKDGHSLERWTQQAEPVSPTHLRIVPIEHALSIGKTALNQDAGSNNGNTIVSQFTLSGDYATLQKVNNELMYVIPLDYRNYGTYSNTAGVPGYVVVDAENQRTIPKLIDHVKMRYMPNAYFEYNLERHLYTHGYSDKIFAGYCFEVDDSLNPYWVVSIAVPTIGYSGDVVKGVAIVNPENGNIQYYELGKVPAWVDRVIPDELVNKNIAYWGKWASGYWNRNKIAGAQSNLREPETTILNYGKDGTCWYVTPLRFNGGSTGTKNDHSGSSSNSHDNATMTDLIYTNSRTGESIRYSVSGATEETLLESVNSHVQGLHYHGSGITYENVANRMTALVPVLASDHNIKGVALVDVSTKNIVWDQTPILALQKYENSLAASGMSFGTNSASSESILIGKVDRITPLFNGSGNDFYISFHRGGQRYMVPQTYPDIINTQIGDSVRLVFFDMPTDYVAVNDFENITYGGKSSKNQKEVRDRAKENHDKENTTLAVTSADNSIRKGQVSNATQNASADSFSRKNNQNN
jgi:hypothetical protein